MGLTLPKNNREKTADFVGILWANFADLTRVFNVFNSDNHLPF